MNRKICFLLATLVTTAALAGSDDTLLPRNSLRLEIAGKSLAGAGFTFERAWRNENQAKHPRAFNSAEMTVGYAGYIFGIISVGVNRNWHLGVKRKWTLGCDLAVAALICPDPTSKAMRNYYDSAQIYSGEYINPVEPWLSGNVSCRYTFGRMFAQAAFTPVIAYDRAYNRGFFGGPWGGLSVGMQFRKKDDNI